MKRASGRFSRDYVAALQVHLEKNSAASLLQAARLGRQALALGLETRELVGMHGRALAALKLSGRKSGSMITRAEIFFGEAINPLVKQNWAARSGKMDLTGVNAMLNRRTAELAALNRRLHRSLLRRQSVAAALQQSGKHYARLLLDSRLIRERLRQLTHQQFSALEQDRYTLSHKLQDDIAQTLLGIHVRLLGLKNTARGDRGRLAKDIAGTQHLVAQSVQAIDQFAGELNLRRWVRGTTSVPKPGGGASRKPRPLRARLKGA